MDEIEYKLNTKNSVLVVNAIDKLISTIKSNYKPVEKQKFLLENEELKFLRDKCSSKEPMVSLTACQGLLALVELGVLETGHTMSTIVTLLPSAHNYTAIISTMAGLLILDLRSRLIPGQTYRCQFTLKSPQHPFITVLEKNKDAEDYVLAQMHALCTHPDYIVSSNSLELLRPVFLWLTCNPQRDGGIRPWQMLLSLPQSTAQSSLLLACLSCQQICIPALIERAFSAYSAVTDAAIYQQNTEYVVALLPMLARISNEIVKYGGDPRSCYNLIERCASLDSRALQAAASLTLHSLAENLTHTSAAYLHPLFNLCLNLTSKYELSTISQSVFIGLTFQWLHLPSYLTTAALKVASKILENYQNIQREDTSLHMSNLKTNKIFQKLLYTDSHLSIMFRLNQNWERMRDNPEKLKSWLDCIEKIDDSLKLELLPFLIGITMEKRKDAWFEEIVLRVLDMVVGLVDYKKEVSVQLMPLLLYKIANEPSPRVKWVCLRALPLMAKTKENVPMIVSILNKLKANKGVPTSFLIMLFTSLAETQVRCFPYLQELLVDPGVGRPDDLKWEVDIARAMAVKRICETRAATHGLEVVSVISLVLNRCGDRAGGAATCAGLASLVRLWRAAAVAPPSTWRALEPKLGRDGRPNVQAALCKLLGEVPNLRVSTPEYDRLVSDAARKLWTYLADSNHPNVVEAACDALAGFKIDDYKLKDIPEIYRRTVKLPASYCKTPADAARKPEDVLDYVPCEIWGEVFKYTNQQALEGVVRLVSRLCERQIRSYRSGVYQLEGRGEPTTLTHLQPTCVVRGVLECFRKQVTSPSHEFPSPVLLAILQTLAAEYPRPLPPLDMSFLVEVFHRGVEWRRGCVKLAAGQAQLSLSARRLLDNLLEGVANGADAGQESDAMLIFDHLPLLCRSMPPNSLRPPLERCLSESFSAISRVKTKGHDEEYLFMKQVEMIGKSLECEKIHDANRTLLSQILESYFAVISDDNVAWPTYIESCKQLSTKYLERMSSPSGWWEVTGELIRKAAALRCAVAATRGPHCRNPLVWLNEIIDAQATQITEQEYSLRCMVAALRAAAEPAGERESEGESESEGERESEGTRDWFLQLMARTQVAFQETEEESAKLYLCDVFMVSVIVFSGHWSLEPELGAGGEGGEGRRAVHRAMFPAAAAALFSRPLWSDATLQMLEWLSHSRGATRCPAAAQCWQRALLALRHTKQFVDHNIWIRLESHFGRDIVEE